MFLYTNKTISRASIIVVRGKEVKNNFKKGHNYRHSSSEKMKNKLGLSWAKLKYKMKLYSKLRVEVVDKV